MELEACEFASEDVINSLPNNVVTHILDRLPLQDAVRTGILSRNWRFKWTMLSQLVLDDSLYYSLYGKDLEGHYGRIISRLLLHLQGAITKVVISVDGDSYLGLDVVDINHWILFFSRNGIKDLTILMKGGEPLVLPTHLFSCLELTHLKLLWCCFDPPTSFNGFPNLLSLDLDLDHMVPMKRSAIGKLITQCPLLEILNIRSRCQLSKMNISSIGKVKLVEIAELINLKIVSLSLCHVDRLTDTDSIFELVGFLPKLHELDLDFVKCKFVEAGGPEEISPTAFPCLKSLKLSRIDLRKDVMLSCAFKLIKCFPNLTTLEVKTFKSKATLTPTQPTSSICSPKVDYNTTGILQFRSVVLTNLEGSDNEVCLIKFLLACSHFLKDIVIQPNLPLASGEKFTFARKLLKLHRASPIVDIDLR